MSRTEHAEITEGHRAFGATVTAHRVGGAWYVNRDTIRGTVHLGIARRDPSEPQRREWVLTVGYTATYHPTLGSALSHAATLAAPLLKAEILAEEAAAAASPPAGEVTSPCSDCGATVPTIRTGEGWPDLPRCPATSAGSYANSHRVHRDAYDAALRLREVQQGLVLLAEARAAWDADREVTPV